MGVGDGGRRCTPRRCMTPRMHYQRIPDTLFPKKHPPVGIRTHCLSHTISHTHTHTEFLVHPLSFSHTQIHTINRQQLTDTLEAGTTIIADRYSYSGVAFSAAKGLDKGWCEAQEVGLPAPDAVFYLSLSLEEAAGRGGFGEERYERRDMQEKVQELVGKGGGGWEKGLGVWEKVQYTHTSTHAHVCRTHAHTHAHTHSDMHNNRA